MIKELLELPMTCSHLSSLSPDGVSANSCVATTRPQSIPDSERIAIIAIGNPLMEEDRAALSLVQRICCSDAGRKYCLFHFDSGFAWLKEVVLSHNSVIIIDSIVDGTNTTDGFVAIPLTRNVLEHSGFVIQATHGLSWLDEVKMIDKEWTGDLLFFGIAGHLFKAGNENERIEIIEGALCKLTETLRKPRMRRSYEQKGRSYA